MWATIYVNRKAHARRAPRHRHARFVFVSVFKNHSGLAERDKNRRRVARIVRRRTVGLWIVEAAPAHSASDREKCILKCVASDCMTLPMTRTDGRTIEPDGESHAT